ncbi:uncharacterized protein LOC9650529 isoform X1 [Selaginella moellendorffii]|uniref:uncharacterized protein LOC9650529 isoform X1 n=1 Tax=Selaginella moellendorffii TaxID=88036 RepID=UPI000D1CFF12|nr:uncharacterized protein LOC9650529 isoform X1 [Selaginella moellendorffii]|eukprot:XP_024529075.1 uncharacterized protein LOC9650529 isoform X1 [Selaginella moellendorffii]
MGALLHKFFLDRGRAIAPDENASDGVDSVLLTGPSCSGKTTLLFHFAINLVSEQGLSNVVIICKRSSMENDPPSLPEDLDTQHLRRISFKYVSDDEDLDKYFAAFHLANPLPQAVIIDSFSEFFEDWIYEDDGGDGQPLEVAMVDSLALCLNAMEHASKESPSEQACKLVISDLSDEAASYMYIYKKYLSRVFVIKSKLKLPCSTIFRSPNCRGRLLKVFLVRGVQRKCWLRSLHI